MKKFIVTTTIQPPTEATLKFAAMKDWSFIVVGDQKTPHELYKSMDIIYLTPEYQEETYKELSDAIGWNCIMRRNLGFVEAFRRGADVVASVDDDNIPYNNWGKNLLIGKTVEVDFWHNRIGRAFDPLSVTNHSELWHRGFPLSEIKTSRKPVYFGSVETKVEIEVGLWDGDPDVDAICRLMFGKALATIKMADLVPFSSDQFIPFNSQNTFISRNLIKDYMVLPHVGRADDIWGGYILQYLHSSRPVFNGVTTLQKRNAQSLKKNLEDECFSYLTTEEFLKNIKHYKDYLPESTNKAFEIYRSSFE
jgi:hypothetical protein